MISFGSSLLSIPSIHLALCCKKAIHTLTHFILYLAKFLFLPSLTCWLKSYLGFQLPNLKFWKYPSMETYAFEKILLYFRIFLLNYQ